MRKKLKILSVLCAGITLFSCVSCTNNSQGENVTEIKKVSSVVGTRHDIFVSESSYDFVKNGQSEYTIVYPYSEVPNTTIIFAVNELRSFIKEATGVVLQAYDDRQFTASDKILSVGYTKQLENSDRIMARYNKEASEFGISGYMIQSDEGSVYMTGRTSDAALYAVYGFLNLQFEFDTYYNDCYYIETNVKNEKLYQYDVVDIPDFQYRTVMNGDPLQDSVYRRRLRASVGESQYFSTACGIPWCHNFFSYVPKSQYGDCAEYYATDGLQLCLTRKTDELVDIVFNTMVQQLIEAPDKEAVSFSLNDHGTWCNCTECSKILNKHSSPNAGACEIMITFINKVAKKMKVWNEENCPEKDIYIYIFSYGQCRFFPVQEDENGNPLVDADGNYMPISDELMLDDNVGVIYCGGANAAYYGIPDHEINVKSDVEQVKRLNAVMKSPKIYFWTYSAYFQDYMMPCNVIDSRQSTYQFAKNLGAVAYYDQAQYNNSASPDWGPLKTYLSAKLMWDTQANVQELIEDFFDKYFLDASDVMLEMFEGWRSHTAYLAENKGVVGNVNQGPSYKTKENFPYGWVMNNLDYINKAYKAVEHLKIVDPTAYQMVEKHINKESLTYRYLKLNMYGNTMSLALYEKEHKSFLDDCIALSVMKAREHGDIFEL